MSRATRRQHRLLLLRLLLLLLLLQVRLVTVHAFLYKRWVSQMTLLLLLFSASICLFC